MIRAARLVACLLCGSVVAGCAVNLDADKITHTDEHRFQVSDRPLLVLSTFDGGITVESWNEPQVLVRVRKRAADLETARALTVRVAQEGDRITVDVPRPERQTRSFGINVGESAALEVRLPRNADVQARTGDGSIVITGVAGRVELRSGDGGIRATDLEGEVVASTGDGSIALERSTGRIDLHSGDGSIRAEGRFERVKVHTGDGSVSVRALEGSRVAEGWEITTGDGSVSVELPRGIDAEIDAHTGDGRISVEGPGLEHGRRERDFKGRLGDGGPPLKVRSGDGSITLRALD